MSQLQRKQALSIPQIEMSVCAASMKINSRSTIRKSHLKLENLFAYKHNAN